MLLPRLAAFSLLVATASATYSSFKPGELWLDTDGNRIKAHSAGLLEHKGTYFMYGADSYTNADGSNRQINVYESTDLYNWANKGAAFFFDCSLANATKCYADRPKVIFNALTAKFVMWMKSTPWTAVATSASPTGPFVFKSRFYPNGEHNGDVTAFVDPESPTDAYWIYRSVVCSDCWIVAASAAADAVVAEVRCLNRHPIAAASSPTWRSAWCASRR
jgi:hypothetical protein